MSTSWHRFAPISNDDHDCRRAECGLVVADDVLERELVVVPCPAPACTDPSNTGPCVLVLAGDDDGSLTAECAYCGTGGEPEEAEEEAEDELDEV